MEPVPEADSMEEFRSCVPPGQSFNTSLHMFSSGSSGDAHRMASNLRRSTESLPTSPPSPVWNAAASIPYRPRTASPLSSAHTKGHPLDALAPAMTRTRSLPINPTASHRPNLRAESPAGSPNRRRNLRKSVDDAFPTTNPVRNSVLAHDRSIVGRSVSPSSHVLSSTGQSMRPASPLRPTSHMSVSLSPAAPTASSLTTMPTLTSQYSYEALPEISSSVTSAVSSSVPSTPMSVRSRSPSISSLETIPDTPDAEEAAMSCELMESSSVEGEHGKVDASIRHHLELPSRGRTLGLAPRDKRKRWSVCGAEGRGDIDLETIWED